jgi:hypothetical protein
MRGCDAGGHVATRNPGAAQISSSSPAAPVRPGADPCTQSAQVGESLLPRSLRGPLPIRVYGRSRGAPYWSDVVYVRDGDVFDVLIAVRARDEPADALTLRITTEHLVALPSSATLRNPEHPEGLRLSAATSLPGAVAVGDLATKSTAFLCFSAKYVEPTTGDAGTVDVVAISEDAGSRLVNLPVLPSS